MFFVAIFSFCSMYSMEQQNPEKQESPACAEASSSSSIARKSRTFTLAGFPTPEKPKNNTRRFLASSAPEALESELHSKKRLILNAASQELIVKKITPGAGENIEEQKVIANEKANALLLQSCVSDEYYNVSKEALEMGADINCVSFLGGSPLHYSVKGSAPRTTKLLLEYEADPCAIDISKDTPLHLAVVYPYTWDEKIYSEKETILKMLLSVKITNINSKNNFGNTPLLRLLHSGQIMENSYRIKLAERLIAAGADIKEENTFGKTAITLAKECGCGEFANTLQKQLEEASQKQQDESKKVN